MQRARLCQILGTVLLVLLPVTGSQATIRYVALDGGGTSGMSWAGAFKTIDAAIQVAVAGDEIRVKQGIYGTGSTLYVNKAVKIYGGYSGVGDARDWQSLQTTLDGANAATHCVDVSANAIIDGFTITRGRASGSQPSDRGGGMYIHECGATISNCTFRGNYSDYFGGALALDNAGGTVISNCVFNENRSSEMGGAMFTYASDATIENCQFEDNRTGIGSADGYGGAMYNHTCSPTISDCTFTANSAQYGAAVNNYLSSAHIEGCIFADCNSTTVSGGGLYNYGGSPTISRCIFQDNHVSRKGGAIWDKSLGTFVNCIMWNNSSMSYGGAIHLDIPVSEVRSAAKFIHCTIYGNSAFQGAALYSDNAAATMVNCIVWGNTTWDEESPGQICNQTWTYDTPTAVSYSDIGDATVYPGTGNISADPQFTNPASGDFHLQTGSPCIDAGTNGASGMPSTDYAGQPRIRDGNDDGLAVADLGAYEVQGFSLGDHVFRGEILQGLVYDSPSDTAPGYTFMLQVNTSGSVDHIGFQTPAGNTFTIPNTEHTTSGNVETSHVEWPMPVGHVWRYRATFPDATGLIAYGDGTYTMTYYLTSGSTREARVGYNLEGNVPIPQPSQKPNVTSPAYEASVASPVTLTWDACTDASTNEVFLTIINAATDEIGASDSFAKDATVSNPYTLNEGTYDVEMSYGNMHDTADNIGVPFEIGKMVTTTHRFSVLYTAVYRFWSPVNSVHFYTISAAERDGLINMYPDFWTYEGPAFHVAATASDPALKPVYRFWSGRSHFYTINEAEKDGLVQNWSSFWTYEGIAFYAYPEGQQPAGTKPVYRFWNISNDAHFYTMSEAEREGLIRDWAGFLLFEGIAYYAYE